MTNQIKINFRKIVVIAVAVLAVLGLIWAVDAIAAPYPAGVGGTGTGASPAAGQVLVGTGSSTYTPAYLLCSGNCSVSNASGTVTVIVPPQTSSTVTIYPVSAATSSFSIVGDGAFINITNPATSTIKVSLSAAAILQLLSAASPLNYNSTTGQLSCASCLTSLNGALLVANNLSDVASTSAARSNLGLGSIATFGETDYLPSTTVYVSSVNGSSGAVTITSSSLGVVPLATTIQATLNALSAVGCLTYSTSTGQFNATCLSTSTAAATYVPYTGATGNVNLGNNHFTVGLATSSFGGNVGIGTTTPAYSLTVASGSNTAFFGNTSPTGTTDIIIKAGPSDAIGATQDVQLETSTGTVTAYLRANDGTIAGLLITPDNSTAGLEDRTGTYYTPGLELSSSSVVSFSSGSTFWAANARTTSLGWIAPGEVGVGNGTAGNASGSLTAAAVAVGTTTTSTATVNVVGTLSVSQTSTLATTTNQGALTVGTSTNKAASSSLYVKQIGSSIGVYGDMGAQVGDWMYFSDANAGDGDVFYVDQFGSLRDTAAGIGGINAANGQVAGLIVSTAGTPGSDGLNVNGTTFLGSAGSTTTVALQVASSTRFGISGVQPGCEEFYEQGATSTLAYVYINSSAVQVVTTTKPSFCQ